MNTALFYTVQPSDSLTSIVADINQTAGISAQEIAKHNRFTGNEELPVGRVICIPYRDKSKQLRYQLKPGDSLESLIFALFLCSGVTEQQVLMENPGLISADITTGMIIAIPAITQSVEYPFRGGLNGNNLFVVKH